MLVTFSGACSATRSVSGPVPAADLKGQIQRFLDSRANRLRSGDVKGYLGRLGPQARQLEDPIATGSRAVPLSQLAFRLDASSFPALEDIRSRDRLDGLKVDLIYRYDGLPVDNKFRISLYYDLARRGNGWTIPSASLQPGSSLPVWATGAVETRRSDHFLALFRPGLADPGRTLQQAEAARAQLEGKMTFSLDDRYLLLIAANEPEYQTMSGAGVGPVSPIAQVETSYEVTPQRIRVQDRQIVVNNSRVQDGSSQETFRHELGHLAVAQYTRPFTPAWVSESAAMYLAGTRNVTAWREGLRERKFDSVTIDQLTRAANLGEHYASPEAASLEYSYSAAAAWYLVETFGAASYWNFYRSYSQVPSAELYRRLTAGSKSLESAGAITSLAVSTTTAALQRFFQLDPALMDLRMREWMGRQSG